MLLSLSESFQEFIKVSMESGAYLFLKSEAQNACLDSFQVCYLKISFLMSLALSV